MRRWADSSLGKIRITRSRRRISWISRSCMLDDFSRRRYFSGNASTASASSSPSSRQVTALGAFYSISSIRAWAFSRASAAVSDRNIRFRPSASASLCREGVCESTLRPKCTWHLCQTAPLETTSDRAHQPLGLVRDHEGHAMQPSALQPVEHVPPETLRLAVTHPEPQHLPVALGIDARDQQSGLE